MAELAAERTRQWTIAAMAERIVRFAELKPCYNAFIDTRSPGSEAKENFTIIGPGVSENPDQHVHITEPHGFNIGGARQPPGCVNSQHSHDTAEVFVVHSGHWQINIGEHGNDAHLHIAPGDVVSVPTGLFRGFTNVGTDTGFLWVVLGKDDPGRVLWAPHVFDLARDHGLILLENGSLIDTRSQQEMPENVRPMPRTTPAQVAAMAIPSEAELDAIVWRSTPAHGTAINPLIGPSAPISADNGIAMARLDLAERGRIILDAPAAPRILFVHRGMVDLAWDGGTVSLGAGDTITVPVGLAHELVSTSGAQLYHVGA